MTQNFAQTTIYQLFPRAFTREGTLAAASAHLADIASLGTVADVMPIVGENRIIVAEGLKKLSVTANIGLEMLLREAGMKNRRLTSSTISCTLS